MTIHFTQTVEDYMALEYRKTKHSAATEKNSLLAAVSLAMSNGCLLYTQLGSSLSSHSAALLSLLLGLLFVPACYFGMKWFAKTMTYLTYKSQTNRLGETTLEVTADGIAQRRGSHKIATAWDKLGHVACEGDHTLIETADRTVYIRPLA